MRWSLLLLLLIALARPVRASLVFGAPSNGPVTATNGVAFDINGDGTPDISFLVASNRPPLGDVFLVLAGSTRFTQFVPATGVFRGSLTGDFAAALNVGDIVGPYSVSLSNFLFDEPGLGAYPDLVYPGSGWTWDGLHHFIGIDLLTTIGDNYYGWIEASIGLHAAQYDVTVYDWAYETEANQPVTIPEPSIWVSFPIVFGLVRRRTLRCS